MTRRREFDSPQGKITILCEMESGDVTYEHAGEYQSACDRNGISTTSYIHALYGLLHQAKAGSVLVIGCAGGTLATLLAQSGWEVTILDNNPAAFALARAFFHLPRHVRCEAVEGSAFLWADDGCYDAIVLDAYHGAEIPAHLVSPSFFRLARARLNAEGLFLANVYVADEGCGSTRAVLDNMAQVWANVRLLDSQGVRNRNAIVMAGAVGRLERPALVTPPAHGADLINAELAAMRFSHR